MTAIRNECCTFKLYHVPMYQLRQTLFQIIWCWDISTHLPMLNLLLRPPFFWEDNCRCLNQALWNVTHYQIKRNTSQNGLLTNSQNSKNCAMLLKHFQVEELIKESDVRSGNDLGVVFWRRERRLPEVVGVGVDIIEFWGRGSSSTNKEVLGAAAEWLVCTGPGPSEGQSTEAVSNHGVRSPWWEKLATLWRSTTLLAPIRDTFYTTKHFVDQQKLAIYVGCDNMEKLASQFRGGFWPIIKPRVIHLRALILPHLTFLFQQVIELVKKEDTVKIDGKPKKLGSLMDVNIVVIRVIWADNALKIYFWHFLWTWWYAHS